MMRSARCDAERYIRSRWRLACVVHALSWDEAGFRRLDAAALRCRIRILLARWLRAEERPRTRVVTAWRFLDGSHLMLLRGPLYPASLEPLPPSGVGALVMRDSKAALMETLRRGLRGFMPELSLLWLRRHGSLPALNRDALLAALGSDEIEIRLAALTSLRACNTARPYQFAELNQRGGSSTPTSGRASGGDDGVGPLRAET